MASRRRWRIIEPKDPLLKRLSGAIPDRWIDEQYPQRAGQVQGRWRGLRTSQLVRIHLLVAAKAVGSFNSICRELRHHIDYRRFCRLHADHRAPSARQLSDFRKDFTPYHWYMLHLQLLRIIARLHSPGPLGIVVLDATDLEAAVSFCLKKTAR